MKSTMMAGHVIRRLNQLSTQVFSRGMQEAGVKLTPVQFAAMDAIATYPGIDQAGVAARIAYDRATIGGVIDRLVQRGYVQRSVREADRRARVLNLTETGATVLREVVPLVRDLQDVILEELNADERDMFLELAKRVIGVTAESEMPGAAVSGDRHAG